MIKVTSQKVKLLLMEDIINITHLRRVGDWMRIWKLPIPQKVKLLLWRVARRCLPTRCNLQKRHVQCTWMCLQCDKFDEDEHHVFFGCKKAEEVQSYVGL